MIWVSVIPSQPRTRQHITFLDNYRKSRNRITTLPTRLHLYNLLIVCLFIFYECYLAVCVRVLLENQLHS